MKQSTKRLLGALICVAMVLAMLPMAVFAADSTTIYVKPNANWLEGGARFAAYFFGNGETWVDCTDEDADGVYECEVPGGYPSVIYCRMNPETTENNWDNKWNQSSDLTVPTDSAICYVVEDGSWDNGNGQWVEYSPETGAEETEETEPVEMVYYVVGSMNEWATSDDSAMTDNGDGTYEITMALTAGEYQYKVTDSMNHWYPDGMGNDLVVVVDADCDVTFTFDSATGLTVVEGSDITVPEVTDPTDPSVPEETDPSVPEETDPSVPEETDPADPSVPEETDPSVPEETDPTEPPVMSGYYVAGQATLCGSEWDAGDVANQMAVVSDGVFAITYENVAAGDYEFKVTDGTWDNSWGADTENGNYWLTVDAESDVTITFEQATNTITVEVVEVEAEETDPTDPSVPEENDPTDPSVPEETDPTDPSVPEQNDPTEPPVVLSTYYVAGVAGLCGSEWNEADPANQMYVISENVVGITYTDVAAGDYEFKITDGTWTNSWGKDGGADNYVLTVEAAGNVTITFDVTTYAITVTVGNEESDVPSAGTPETDAPETDAPETDAPAVLSDYYVAGQAGLCGSDWDPADPNNQMYVGADGICYITFENVAVGEYQFKVTKGNWDENWGGTGPDGNYLVKVEVAGDVTITFNPATGEIGVRGAIDSNPQTGDMGISAVAVALLAAAAGVVAIVNKKEF